MITGDFSNSSNKVTQTAQKNWNGNCHWETGRLGAFWSWWIWFAYPFPRTGNQIVEYSEQPCGKNICQITKHNGLEDCMGNHATCPICCPQSSCHDRIVCMMYKKKKKQSTFKPLLYKGSSEQPYNKTRLHDSTSTLIWKQVPRPILEHNLLRGSERFHGWCWDTLAAAFWYSETVTLPLRPLNDQI